MRLGVVRLEGNRPSVACGRLLGSALRLKRDTEILVRLDKVRRYRQRTVQQGLGEAMITPLRDSDPKIIKGRGVGRVGGEHTAEKRFAETLLNRALAVA